MTSVPFPVSMAKRKAHVTSRVEISYASDSSDSDRNEQLGLDGSNSESDTAAGQITKLQPLEDVPADEPEASMEHVESGDGSSDSGSESESDKDGVGGGVGLANVMAGILRKESPQKGSVILSKAHTDRQREYKKMKTEEPDLQNSGEQTEKKKRKVPLFGPALEAAVERERRLKKKRWEEMGRVKPNVADKIEPSIPTAVIERKLKHIATKGVVQLFNAVKKQQKSIDEKLKSVGSSERKRDKVLKSVSKGAFLDMLKESNNNISEEGTKILTAKESKTSRGKPTKDDADEKPSWGILRDDFMMGAKMKDWDKESEDDSETNRSSSGSVYTSDDDVS